MCFFSTSTPSAVAHSMPTSANAKKTSLHRSAPTNLHTPLTFTFTLTLQINTSVQDASHIITSVQDGSTHQFRMHPFFSHCLSPTLLLARDLSHCLSQLTDTHLCYLWLLARDLLLARSGFLDPACLVLVVPQPPASGAIHQGLSRPVRCLSHITAASLMTEVPQSRWTTVASLPGLCLASPSDHQPAGLYKIPCDSRRGSNCQTSHRKLPAGE